MKLIVRNLLMLMVIGCAVGRVCADQFAVEGKVSVNAYERGQVVSKTGYNFFVVAGDGSSKIRLAGEMHSKVEFVEYGWDKTNSYLLVKFLTNRTSNVVGKLSGDSFTTVTLTEPVRPQNHATLTLYANDELPQYNYGFEPVWLAYASGPYFNARKSGEGVEPHWSMGKQVRGPAIRFKCLWRLTPASPYFPEFVIDFTDGNEYESTGSKSITERMEKPFDTELTNSVYEVLSWTNFGPLVLPATFRVTQYVPDPDASSTPTLLVAKVFEGVANRIHSIFTAESLSAMSAGAIPTRVLDKRFANAADPVDTVAYLSPTGRVMSMEEVKKSEAYKQALGGREPQFEPKRTRFLFIVIFLAAAAFPVWLLAKRK